ncbi:AI-2E family transporter [Amnibacterium kyonggiense]
MHVPQLEDPATGRLPGGARGLWEDRFGRYAVRSLQLLLITACVGTSLWLLFQLRDVVVPVLLALLLAAAFQPLIGLLRRAHVPRLFAAVIALVLGVGAVAAVVGIIVARVQGQWKSLVDAANSGVAQLQTTLAKGPITIDQSQLDTYRSDVVHYLTSAQFGSSALAGLETAAEVITTTLVLIITLFFFLKDGDRIAAFLTRRMSPERRARAYRIGHAGMHSLGGYVRGTALIALVDATLIGGSLFVLNVPLAFALSVLVFIGAFVPIVGATIAGTIAILVALVTNGLGTAITALVIVLVVNQLEAHVLQPLIMGRSVELYPLVVLLSLIVGAIGAGIFGAIIAVPVAAVVWDAMRLWDEPPTAEGGTERIPAHRQILRQFAHLSRAGAAPRS